ncbi:MAG: DUF2804 domain-containing protein [Nitrospirae bacterium]|nr:DUF2804 domain-containing protein [Nitrospirota bacterium]
MQHEIRSKGPLLRPDGRLVEKGWSRRPFKEFNPLKAQRLRLKEWDYLGIFDGDQFITVMIAHLGYLAIGAIQVLDLKSKQKVVERMAPSPLGFGCLMAKSSEMGTSRLHLPGHLVQFEHSPIGREIRGRWPGVDVELHADPLPRGHDSIVMHTPIGDRGYYYNHKTSGLRVTGSIHLKGKSIHLGKAALATLDWGRGVWERITFWNWATACGYLGDGRSIRLNLGCGFGDLSAATENCFLVDGKIVKLGNVTFEYDVENLERPWRMQGDDGSLDLQLQPLYLNTKKTHLGFAWSRLHQVFGEFNGTVRHGKQTIRIKGLRGWAEEHRAHW